MDELVKYMRALVALQVQGLNKDGDPVKPEVLLVRSGLPVGEVAEMLGKSSAAVAKANQRAGKSGR